MFRDVDPDFSLHLCAEKEDEEEDTGRVAFRAVMYEGCDILSLQTSHEQVRSGPNKFL